MRRGDVRWYRFAGPDKKRPVLVLTRDSVLPYLGEVTVAPLTTTIRGIPSEVVVATSDGVPQDCAINCDHIQTVQKAKLGALIAFLPEAKMTAVSLAIQFALDLDL